MDPYELYARAGLALGMGFLIGLQREQSIGKIRQPGAAPGGVRTYPLTALVGLVSALLSRDVGRWVIGLAFAALLVPLAIAYADDVRRGRNRGTTSETAAILTFLLGVLCVAEIPLLFTASIGVVATALLSMKRPLHEFAARLSSDDLYATLKFCVLAVVALPLLPNRAFDPLDALNPFQIGLMVLLIAGIGFAGYVSIRILGPAAGLGITGLLGGVVSSTAVTVSLSGRARRQPAAADACAQAVVVACLVMFPRVLVIAAVVNPSLALLLGLPILAASAAGLAAAGLLYARGRKAAPAAEGVEFKNPFELKSALMYGIAFAAVLFATKAAAVRLGTGGLYATGFLVGTVDVDSIALSMSRLAGADPLAKEAAAAILIACGANTVSKGALAIALGGWAYGRQVGAALLAMLAAGALAAVFLVW